MGAVSFFIFFFTLLVLARQVSLPAHHSRASLGRVRQGPHICDLVPLTLSLNFTFPGANPNGLSIGSLK